MNAQQFLEWMRNPGKTAREDGAQLDALLDSFPYFQSGHLLYIKNLHNQGSFLYNNQLKTAAAYVVNRKVLYELITKKDSAVEQPARLKLVEQVNRAEVVEPPEISIPPKFPSKRFVNNPDEWEAGMLRQLQLLHHWSTGPKPEPVIEKQEKLPVVKDDVVETKEVQPTISSEREHIGAKDEINTLLYVLVEPGEPEDLNEELQEESGQFALSEESSEDTKWEITPSEVVVPLPIEKSEVFQGADSVQQEILVEAIHSTFSLEVSDHIPSLSELSVLNAEVPVVTPSVETTVSTSVEETVVSGLELSFSQWLQEVNKTVPAELPKTSLTGDKLIEQFIKEEPRIKVKKSGFFNPVNMAKKSVQESDEFVTETLARIYAKQGSYHKAIRAYQKLSLKFPEKTTYFAALIEDLKRTPDKPSQK